MAISELFNQRILGNGRTLPGLGGIKHMGPNGAPIGSIWAPYGAPFRAHAGPHMMGPIWGPIWTHVAPHMRSHMGSHVDLI